MVVITWVTVQYREGLVPKLSEIKAPSPCTFSMPTLLCKTVGPCYNPWWTSRHVLHGGAYVRQVATFYYAIQCSFCEDLCRSFIRI